MKAFSTLRRLTEVVLVLFRYALSNVAAHALQYWPGLNRWSWPRSLAASGRLPGPERLRLMLEELGGSAIKLGQMLALQPDLLPIAYCNGLADLMDRVPSFDFGSVQQIIASELGSDCSELFDWIDPQPIA